MGVSNFLQVWYINWGKKLISLILKVVIILKGIFKILTCITAAEPKCF